VKRSRLKKQLKAKAARSRARVAKGRNRKLVIGDVTFTFFVGKAFTDIRGPREKWLVPHWTMNKMTQTQYEDTPTMSVETGCFCMTCDCGGWHRDTALCITPSKIREFLVASSVEANKAASRERAAIAATKLATYPARRSRKYGVS
jgi:hypothetical protein